MLDVKACCANIEQRLSMPCASCVIHPETKGQGERAEGVGDKGGGCHHTRIVWACLARLLGALCSKASAMAPLGPASPGAEKNSSVKSPDTLGHVVLGERNHVQIQSTMHGPIVTSTRGLVAMTSASHAEGRQFDPGRV